MGASIKGRAGTARGRVFGCCLLILVGSILLSNNAKGSRQVNSNLRENQNSGARAVEENFEHKIGRDDPGMIWIVNQPKCGTGSIESSIVKALNCVDVEDVVVVEGMHKTRFMECAGGKKLFRNHSPQTERVKEKVNGVMEASGTKPDRCVAVTAVRDPHLSIPSLFFEKHKAEYCDGTQSEEEILGAYDDFLLNDKRPQLQVETTAKMLRSFGVTDVLGAMDLLKGRGYAFFDKPARDGPWSGCELLFLQLDYEESNHNMDVGLDHAIEGVKMLQGETRESLCPKAADNYHALINHEITDEHIDKLSESNPEMRHIMGYYRRQQAMTKSQ